VLLPLQVREDAGLLHLPFEAAKHPLEIVTFVDDYLYHLSRFTSSSRRRRRRSRVLRSGGSSRSMAAVTASRTLGRASLPGDQDQGRGIAEPMS
jgi:hypothetical protein